MASPPSNGGHVFPRVLDRALPTAVAAEGAWIVDADGTRYLDGAGGAIVVGIGHGDAAVIEAAREQFGRTQYVHGTMFTTEAVESYAEAVAGVLPIDDARIYPVSGGSEAVETAIKMARAYHLARGASGRVAVIGRRSSYHGNTLGALDASGKEPVRKPYTPWLGRFLHAPAAYEYRCENPAHPDGCGAWHAAELTRMIESYGPDTIAAFIAEPIGGATLGAAVPSEDYWPAIVEVCRRYGVLVIADEVMTGFGRTGRWFGDGRVGRASGHPHGGEGDDERLRAVRLRRGLRRGVRDDRGEGLRARVHLVAPRARRGDGPRGAPAAPRRRARRSQPATSVRRSRATSPRRSTRSRSWAMCAASAC